MCGLAGFVLGSRMDAVAMRDIGQRMAQTLVHRGPDDGDVWQEGDLGVVLAHRRLAILDVSPAGHQPMVSHSGRFVLVFNGEVYNHLDLRAALAEEKFHIQWRGHSDTETLLAGFDAWGIETTLRKAVGMFALAVWDKFERALTLARDRLGEKPLYYGWQGATFLFGSELKALKAHPAFVGEIDRDALALQMRHNYIPVPYSIYRGIYKLPPGTFLRLPLAGLAASAREWAKPTPYWSFAAAVESGIAHPFSGGDAEAVDGLEALLRSAVQGQMLADVPLGAFLSGGVDSSTVVALMQAQSVRPVKTFTIGFNEGDYNEAQHAKAVARHLGTEHTELYVSPADALAVIPRLAMLYDEPFSDSSQIPTFLVAQLARQQVTVALSGDGGDELFGGYNRYFLTHSWWNRVHALPDWVRHSGRYGIHALRPAAWDGLGRLMGRLLPERHRHFNVGNKLYKLAGVLAATSPASLYRHFVSHWPDPARIVVGATEPPTQVSHPSIHLAGISEQMMALDTVSYLPDDILVKVDRAAMGVSLETRVPLLDHRVVEYAWSLPLSMKIRNGQGKWILRQVLYKYVPKELIERSKRGFSVPIDGWLRGPLREWAENLLDEERLKREGYFQPGPIRQKWIEHLSGRRNWQYHLWDVLMFQAWLEEQRV